MKSVIKSVAAMVLTGIFTLPVLADEIVANTADDSKDQKDLKKVIETQSINYVETAQKGITLSGYVDTSYTEQFSGRNTVTSNQVNSGTGPNANGQAILRQFDQNNDNFNINAVKVALEKALPDRDDWAAGFRIDTIYGADAQNLNAASGGNVIGGVSGTTSSDFYLEQALVKFRIPIGNGVDICAGKFVTFLGYEVIESPANPNFSRGLLFTNAIPLTNTGVYADYHFNDMVEAKFGIVDGWNTSVTPNNFTSLGLPSSDESFGDKAITGQVAVTAPGKNATVAFSFIYSPQSELDVAAPFNPFNPPLFNAPTTAGLYVLDLWGNWTPTFDRNGNTTFGFNLDYGSDSYSWWGAALYAQYRFNKVVSLAARGEYLHSDVGANKFGADGYEGDGGTFIPASQDDFSETLTLSFAVWDNLLTRLEYRFDDLSKGTTGTHSVVQNEISAEAVYSF